MERFILIAFLKSGALIFQPYTTREAVCLAEAKHPGIILQVKITSTHEGYPKEARHLLPPQKPLGQVRAVVCEKPEPPPTPPASRWKR